MGHEAADTLWLRGGFPPSFLADSDAAMESLQLDRLDVVFPGEEEYALGERMYATPLRDLVGV
ncbi:MAG: hypothetical protein JRI25_16930 [Deltaproteobacteria bacterium]|nr:hypothetical protein [Deltaproteobacteria bacterium]